MYMYMYVYVYVEYLLNQDLETYYNGKNIKSTFLHTKMVKRALPGMLKGHSRKLSQPSAFLNKSVRGDQKRWYIMRRNSQNHQISQKPTISQIVCFLNRKCTTLFQRLRTLYITIQLRFTFFDIPYE